MKRTRLLAVVALVVLAGCGGQTATTPTTDVPSDPSTQTPLSSTTSLPTSEPTSLPTSEPTLPGVAVKNRGATLGDVNASRVWARVGRLVGVDHYGPPIVVVEQTEPHPENVSAPQFYRSFGARGDELVFNESAPSGWYDAATHRVVLRRAPGTSDAWLESLLVHEFAHAYQANAIHSLPENASQFAETAVREGGAEFVAWLYADRYVENFSREATMTTLLRQAWTIQRIGLVPYAHGARYARNHSDPGAPLESLYENPPTTAEQVLHGLEPGSEPPRPLSVRGETDASWSWDSTTTNRFGEARLRYVLEIGLPRDRAATAAAGWGNDRRMTFASSSGNGYAWVVRWDSVADADEFERAFADFRANVSNPLALQSVGDETTVLLAGNESFVGNATVSGTPGNVTVAA